MHGSYENEIILPFLNDSKTRFYFQQNKKKTNLPKIIIKNDSFDNYRGFRLQWLLA